MEAFPYSVLVEGDWGARPAKVIKNKLQIHFQSKKKSNGGECQVEYQDNTRRAVVCFKCEEVRDAVLSKDHEIAFDKDKVKLQTSPSPVCETEDDTNQAAGATSQPSVLTNDGPKESPEGAEKTPQIAAIVLENIPKNISKDYLELMVENICSSSDADFSMEMIYEKKTAVVSFSNINDGGCFLSKCSNNSKFQQNGLCARPLEQTRSLRVENLPLQASEELLELYFEKEVGRGKVNAIKMIREERASIITFSDPEVVESVQGKKHQICKDPVNVYPYYESIGMALYGKDRPMFKLPDPFTERIHSAVWKFMLQKKQLGKIHDQMKTHFCKVDFDTNNVMLSPLPALLLQKDLNAKTIDNWRKNAASRFFSIMAKYKSFDCRMNPSAWKVSEKELLRVTKQTLLLAPDDTKGVVTVVGFTSDVCRLKQAVEDILYRTNSRVERERNCVYEEMDITPAMFKILQHDRLQQRVASSYPEMSYTYKADTKKLILYGLANEVLSVKSNILERQLTMKRKRLEVEPGLIRFLTVVDSEEMSNNLFTSNSISAMYCIEEDGLVVTGSSESALFDAERKLKETLMCQSIDVEDLEVLRKPEWQALNNKLKQSFSSSKRNKVLIKFAADNKIEVSGFCHSVGEVCRSLSDFFNKYTCIKETVPVKTHAVLKFIQERKKEVWKKCASSKEVEVVFESKKPQIQLSGSRICVQEVKTLFNEIAASLYADDLKILKPGAKKYFLEKRNHIFSRIMKDSECIVLLREDDMLQEEEEKEAVEEKDRPSTYCKVQTPSGVTITVVKANLCQFQVDAVINASNEDLKHIGGLAAALLKAAGPLLQEACDLYTSVNGPLKPGETVVTEPGRLPCKYVIHACCPRFRDSEQRVAIQLLRRAVKGCLFLAMEHKCHSMAMPAISSGIFGFPLELCAETIARALHEHCEDPVQGRSSLREIHLVNNDEKTVLAMTKAVNNVFADCQPELIALQKAPVKPRGRENPLQGECPSLEPKIQLQERNVVLGNRLTGEGLKIILIRGKIQEIPAAVIVNTISDDLDLGKGAVSKAILAAAGTRLQSTIKEKAVGDKIKYGHVLVTDGCNLRCKHIFHAACPPWDNGRSHSEQQLISIIWDCLKKAEKWKAESICFPAIGSGNMGFPRGLIANLMLTEVQAFSQNVLLKHLKEVIFSIHPDDAQTVECFIREFKGQKEHGLSDKTQTGASQTLKRHKSPLPQSGPGFLGLVSLSALGTYSMPIGQLNVEVSSGDITKQATDAIVNSSNSSFTLKAGVSKAILDAAGWRVEQECIQLGSQPHKGIILTKAGQLPCKRIIHIIGQNNPNKIREMVFTVLLCCEDNKFNSVTFPALGTGAGGASPSLVADAMIDALVDFAKNKNVQFLKNVQILLFQPGMVLEFHKSLKRKEGTDSKAEKSLLSKAGTSFSSDASTMPSQNIVTVGEKFAPTVFNLCGESPQEVFKTKKWILDIFAEVQMEKTIKDSLISHFTQQDLEKIFDIQRKLTVNMRMERRGSDSFIQLEGLTQDVLTFDSHIRDMIREVQSNKSFKSDASFLAKIVEWQYKDKGSFRAFDMLTNHTLEQAKNSQQSMVNIKIDQVEYIADVCHKVAVSGTQSVKLKRMVKIISDLPSHWKDMSGSKMLQVSLTPSSQEFQNVKKEFTKTGLSFNLLKIERIQNSTLWQSYHIKKNSLDEKYNNTNNEMQLFHGTSVTTVEKINNHGFNRSFAGKNAAVIGNGTYFAVDPSYSAQDTYSKPDHQGNKYMYYARVLVGQYTQGSSGLLEPPPKSSADPADLYDCVVNHMKSPTVFVIFNDLQAYPEYLITFR